MIKIDKNTKEKLLELGASRNIFLEGNILKVINSEDDEEFKLYISEAIGRDKSKQRKRLDITKKVQSQNTDLTVEKRENARVNRQLTKALEKADISKARALSAKEEAVAARIEAEASKEEVEKAWGHAEEARVEAENAKISVQNDLELIQKKNQFELIEKIVKVALWIILGVGIVTTFMYILALLVGIDATVIGSTWSNIIGILLTNSFSIVGTIMGVKYAMEKKGS